MWVASKRQEQGKGHDERLRRCQRGWLRGGFLIFNARSSSLKFLIQYSPTVSFNPLPIFPSLPILSPPRQLLTDDDAFPLIFRHPVVGEDTRWILTLPLFLSIKSRNLYPSPSTLFNGNSPHPQPPLPLHMSYPHGHSDDATPQVITRQSSPTRNFSERSHRTSS